MDDDGFFVFADFFNRAFGAHHHRAAAGQISRFGAALTQNQTTSRKIRPRNDIDQLIGRDVRIINISAAGINHFAQVMRRHVGCHADGDTVGTVDQQIRKTCRQNRRFLHAFIIVGHKVNRVVLNVFNQLVGDLGKSGFGITHSRGAVAVHGTEVALPVYQRQTHGKRLRHAHHSLINRAVAVRVVFTQNLADDTGRFAIRFGAVITVFIHRINNTAMHRF